MAGSVGEEAMTKRRRWRKEVNRGPWTAEEDRKLAGAIDIHGAKQWATIAAKAGLMRCSKSCRLRWMNDLRPNIKRGNMSDQEEDLIIRLHKLLGNRWSLIAARLPGRTDNEIKNYWKYHLSKKKVNIATKETGSKSDEQIDEEKKSSSAIRSAVEDSKGKCDGFDDFFDFSNENPSTLEWITKFLEFSNA